MNDWRKPCEHGVYVGEHSTSHWDQNKLDYVLDESSVCSGGVPLTAADLEGLGHRMWACVNDAGEPVDLYRSKPVDQTEQCDESGCGWRLLIPIPDPQEVEA